MTTRRPSGTQIVSRPLWPVALESLLMREFMHLWFTGEGELLIDSAWVSNFHFRSVIPSRFGITVGLPKTETLSFADYLQAFIRLGGAVRLMFRGDPQDPSNAMSSLELAREISSSHPGILHNSRWRVPGAALQIRSHTRGHSKRLLGLRAGYVGSANLTSNGLFNDRDDTMILWGEEALLPFVNAFLRDWDAATPWDAVPL